MYSEICVIKFRNQEDGKLVWTYFLFNSATQMRTSTRVFFSLCPCLSWAESETNWLNVLFSLNKDVLTKFCTGAVDLG